MKSKLKQAALIISFLVFANTMHEASAQSNLHLFVHGFGMLPMEKSSNTRYSTLAGAEAGVQLGRENTFFTGTVGYGSLFGKDDFANSSYIPVRLGIRQSLPFTGNMVYVHTDAGLGFIDDNNLENSDPRFSFDVGAGINLKGFEVELAVDAFKEPDPYGWSSWFGIKAGWRFGLN